MNMIKLQGKAFEQEQKNLYLQSCNTSLQNYLEE